jgi:antitoxin (DNA-binding transcriptional repressor) of toxin-antitoxin stability system
MISVSVQEAKEKLEELIEKALAGETVEVAIQSKRIQFVVTSQKSVEGEFIPERDDPEHADLYKPKKATRKLGSAKGQVWMSDDFDAPLEEFKEYIE